MRSHGCRGMRADAEATCRTPKRRHPGGVGPSGAAAGSPGHGVGIIEGLKEKEPQSSRRMKRRGFRRYAQYPECVFGEGGVGVECGLGEGGKGLRIRKDISVRLGLAGK
jgi:hypothetical protein